MDAERVCPFIRIENDEHRIVSQENIADIPRDPCCICMTGYRLNNVLTRLNCGHITHYACLIPSLVRVASPYFRNQTVFFAEQSFYQGLYNYQVFLATSDKLQAM